MRAMVLDNLGSLLENPQPLAAREVSRPDPAAGHVLIRVGACGVCHTELDEIEGRLPPSALPRILGHQVVGQVEAAGFDTPELLGTRVGVAWIHRACGRCSACATDRENLCREFVATGRDVNGGYAEYMTAPADFVHRIPPVFTDAEAAPLLCAGAIGHRSLQLANLDDGQPLGLTGFGAAGHPANRRAWPEVRVLCEAARWASTAVTVARGLRIPVSGGPLRCRFAICACSCRTNRAAKRGCHGGSSSYPIHRQGTGSS